MATEEEVEGVEEKLYCFLAKARECSAECMAYVTFPRETKGDLSTVQRHCVLLTSVESIARHANIFVRTMVEADRRAKTNEQDQKREEAKGTGPFAHPITGPFPVTPKEPT